MNAHLRLAGRLGGAALILAGAIAGALILVAVAPVAAAVRRVRRGRRRDVPGLPDDGEPLDLDEAIAFTVIAAGWKHTAPERTRP